MRIGRGPFGLGDQPAVGFGKLRQRRVMFIIETKLLFHNSSFFTGVNYKDTKIFRNRLLNRTFSVSLLSTRMNCFIFRTFRPTNGDLTPGPAGRVPHLAKNEADGRREPSATIAEGISP